MKYKLLLFIKYNGEQGAHESHLPLTCTVSVSLKMALMSRNM